jgi:hypothetical protein
MAMAAPWYDISDPRPDTAWELYHENSRRGPQDGVRVARSPLAPPDHAASPGVALPDPPPAQSAATLQPDVRTPVLAALSSLLAAAFRAPLADDPVTAYVAAAAVESLPPGISRYDPASHRLHMVRRDDPWPPLRAALAVPSVLDRTTALILLVADLDAATAAAGERGYRDALIATGRRLSALDAAASAAGIGTEPVAFYDREVDALLHLDGLARSVLAAAALTSR